MQKIYSGNAYVDGPKNRHWIVGHFMNGDDVRHSKDVEIKWGVHPKGESRPDWALDPPHTTLTFLISGRLKISFRDSDVELQTRGDYVIWDRGVDHKWEALEDSETFTVRWPSMPQS